MQKKEEKKRKVVLRPTKTLTGACKGTRQKLRLRLCVGAPGRRAHAVVGERLRERERESGAAARLA